jgi:LuxR family transcriptional regulator, regulator of acetate metabolism
MMETLGMTRQESVSMILRGAVESIRDSMDPQAVFAASASLEGHTIGEHHGLQDPRWADVVVRPGRGLGGRVINELAPVAIDDYFHDSSITGDYRPIVQAENLQSLACVPVKVNGQAEALLYVAPRRGESLGAKLVDQVLCLAGLTAVCLLHIHDRTVLAAEARRALRLDDPAALRAVARRLVGAPRESNHAPDLTARQLEVLDLLASGMSNAELALRLEIAETTVKEHVRDLCRKLEASSRLQAVARAREMDLI